MSNQSVMICKMERSENRKVQTLEEKVAVSHSLKKKKQNTVQILVILVRLWETKHTVSRQDYLRGHILQY